jgi:hypothetical protein
MSSALFRALEPSCAFGLRQASLDGPLEDPQPTGLMVLKLAVELKVPRFRGRSRAGEPWPREGARFAVEGREMARRGAHDHCGSSCAHVKTGETFTEIADAEGISNRRIRKMIAFDVRAPGVVRDVLDGKQPAAFASG